MKVIQACQRAIQYISEAVARIFAPNEEHYPATGVQPFEGEPFKGSGWAE
jgi:hypothetical protein